MIIGLAAEDSVNGLGFWTGLGGLNIEAIFVGGFGSDFCSKGLACSSGRDAAKFPFRNSFPDAKSLWDTGQSSII